MSFVRRRKIIALVMAGVFVFGATATIPTAAYAQFSIPNLERIEQGRDVAQFFLDILGGVVRNTLNSVLGKLAYDAAVFISSGGKGQDSLVFSQPADEYFTDVADAAAGGVIEGFAEGAGLNAAGLCDPGSQFRVGLTISLGDLAGDKVKPLKYHEPACTLTELAGNWTEAFDSPNFSDYVDLQFDTSGNPMGIALEVQDQAIIAISEAEVAAEIERSQGGFKDKVSTVSKTILTPSATIEHELESKSDATQRTFDTVGKPFTDAIGIFSTTLVSKLMQRLQAGLANLANPGALASLLGGQSRIASGREAAQARFAEIRQPIFAATGSFDILGELGACPDQEEQRTVNNCAIGSRMELAITEGWTIQEFVDSLEGADGFRFADDSLTSADLENGVTYRGILLLKKYRIVPVGWQLAAEYIRFENTDEMPSLQELVDDYEKCGTTDYSPFCGLIDPAWVLKAPQNFCVREAPSEDLVSAPQTLDDDGLTTTQDKVLFNRLNYCADSRGCIQEKEEGVCTAYGYCTAEDRIYRFAGQACEESYSSCQTFTDPEGEDASLLKSSLNYDDCATDPGCQWYCTSTNEYGQYDCASPTETYISCSEDVATNEADYGLPAASLDYNLNESCSCSTERTCEVAAGSDLGYDAPPGDGVFDYWQCLVTNDPGSPTPTSLCELDDPCGAGNPNFDPDSGTCTCSIQETCSENAGDADCQTPNGNTCVIDENNDSTADACSADLAAYSSAPVCAPAGNPLNCGTCTVPYGQTTCTTELGNEFTLSAVCNNTAGCPGTVTDTCSISNGAFSCTSAAGNLCILGTQAEEPVVANDTIYFDSNVQACDSSDAGCSQYIRVLPNTNLIPNAFFSYYDTEQNTLDDADSDFAAFCTHDGGGCFTDASCDEDLDGTPEGQCVGWEQTNVNARLLTGSFSASTSPELGDNYLRMTTDTVGDGSLDMSVDTGRELYNRTFTFAYRAASQQADTTTCNLSFTIGDANGNETDVVTELAGVTDENGNSINSYSSDWRDYFHTITFPDEDNYGGSGDSGTTIKISVAENPACEIDIDGAMLLESDEFPGSYADYAEANVTQLNGDTLSCQPEDVGCELYVQQGRKDKDGVPGIITNPDSSACTGLCDDPAFTDQATCVANGAIWDDAAYNYGNPQCSQCTGNEAAEQDPDHYVGCGFFQEVSLDTTSPLTEDLGFLAFDPEARTGVMQRYGGRCSDDNSVHCFNDSDCIPDPGGTCDLQLSVIPKTAGQCALSQVGCEEYTNLDTVAQGGEGLEYYTQLKQCVKTNDPGIDTFFTFEGSDTEGIQIVEHLLKKEPATNAPCTSLHPASEDYNADCNDQDADGNGVLDSDCGPSGDDAYGPASPNFDPDCRQYINSAGDVFYRYESQVVAASDSCIPLRNSLDTRVYYGIPQLSNACAPAANGCREYRGTDAANEADIINETFTLNSTENWNGATSTSNESLSELDYSLQLHDNDTATDPEPAISYNLFTELDSGEVNGDLTPGAAYTLTFWAKVVADGTATFMIDGADTFYYFTTTGAIENDPVAAAVTLDPNDESGWQYYQLGPVVLDDQEDFDQNTVTFTMQFDGAASDTLAYIDNVRLAESNSQFLIQDTFEYCQGFEGCREYTDRADNVHYLKSFVRLCGDSVVGCELMLDTQNSNHPLSQAFNLNNEYDQDDVVVPADGPTTLVYDEDNECANTAYGCTEIGLPDTDERTGQIREFTNAYLLNRPDDYGSTLCEQPQLQCKQYTSEFDGTVYFKDPGDRLCSLKQYTDETGNLVNGWFKKGSLSDTPDCPQQHPQADPSQPLGGVCNSNSISHAADGTPIDNKVGKLCNQDADCFPSGWSNADPLPRCISVIEDDVDVFDGQVHQYQTRANDNISLSTQLSDFGWAGQCPEEQSGCSEYVDPYSPNISEINRNWSFEDDARTVTGVYYTEASAPDGYPDWWYVDPNATLITDVNGTPDEDGNLPLVPSEVDIEGDGTIEFNAACTENPAIAVETGSPAYTGTAVSPADGDSAVRLTNCVLQNYRWLTVDPAKLYTVSAMVKLPNQDAFGGNANPIQFSIGLQFKDEDNNVLTTANGVTPAQFYVTANHVTIPATAYEQDADGLSTWYKVQGNIGLGSTVEFPANAALARVFVANHSASPMYFDAVSFKQNDKYYYLDYTVDGTMEKEQQDSTNSCFNQDADQSQITSDGGCVAFRDITFDTQSYSQDALDCASCLLTPNSDSCRGIIDACDTNTVLKVKKDRTCSEWLGCETAEVVTSDDGVDSVQCFEFGRCSELDLNGQCKSWEAKPAYSQLNSSTDLHYTSAPGDADSLVAIRDLTGYVKAGLTWTNTRQCADGPHANVSCTQNSDCFDENDPSTDQPWTCAPPLQVEGYYPYGWLPEVGLNGAETGKDLIEFNDFERLYCAGEQAKADLPCILNRAAFDADANESGHCYSQELQNKVETSQNTDNPLTVNDVVFTGSSEEFYPSADHSFTPNASKAFCPNSDDFGEFWPFGGESEGWQALAESLMFISQYDQRIDCETDACENIDVNNVLQFSADQSTGNTFGGGVQYKIEDGISPNGLYSLSFDARFAGPATYAGEDVINPTAVSICLNHEGIFNASGNELERKDCFVEGLGQADIIFAIDTSGSMEDEIDAIAGNPSDPSDVGAASALASELSDAGISARFALIDMDYVDLDGDRVSDTVGGYRDATDTTKENFNDIDLDFTDDITAFTTAVSNMSSAGARVDGFNAIYEAALNQFTQGGLNWPAPDDAEIYQEDALTNREGANRFLILVTDVSDELDSLPSASRNNGIGNVEALGAVQQVDMPVYLLTDNDTLNGCSVIGHGTTTQSGCVTAGGIWSPDYGIYANVISASDGAQYSYQDNSIPPNTITDWVNDTTIVNDLFSNILQHVNVFQFTQEMERYTLGPIQAVERSLDDPEVNAAASQSITTSLEFTVSDSTSVQIDNVSMLPVLETNKDLPAISRTCRAYPENNAKQCDYTQPNGTTFEGWKGYCLETDPIKSERCITWFPLEVLAGEESIVPRTPSGYLGRSGVFYCLVSKGLQTPGFCDANPTGPITTDFTTLPGGDFGEGVICTIGGGMCSTGPCRTGLNYGPDGLSPSSRNSYSNAVVSSSPSNPADRTGEYTVEPMRWDVHDPFEANGYIYGVGTITRIPANETLRNINIAEMESLIFNTGSMGAMQDPGTDTNMAERTYWGQLGMWGDWETSQANFDASPDLPDDPNDCSDTTQFPNGCDAFGNWNLLDFAASEGGGSIRRDGSGNYQPWLNCGSYNSDQGLDDTAGFGCRVWGLYDSEFLPTYYEDKSEAELREQPHGLDVVYTWAWSNYDWGFGTSDGASANCQIVDSDGGELYQFTSLEQSNSSSGKIFTSPCMSPNIKRVMGTVTEDGSDVAGFVTSDNVSRNPWNHLGSIFNNDPNCASNGSCGIYVPEVTTEEIASVGFTNDDLGTDGNWGGWAELGDQYLARSAPSPEDPAQQGSQYGGNIVSVYFDVNDQGYIQAVYTLVYFGAPGTLDGPTADWSTLVSLEALNVCSSITATFPFLLPLCTGLLSEAAHDEINDAINGYNFKNLVNTPTVGGAVVTGDDPDVSDDSAVSVTVPPIVNPMLYDINAFEGVDLTYENQMSLKIQTRESCALIGEAASQNGDNMAWASRANTGGYQMHTSETIDPALQYGVEEETRPYGSISILDDTPDRSTWDAQLKTDPANTFAGSSYGPQPVYSYTASPEKISSGHPLSCLGDCDTRYCVGNPAKQDFPCTGNTDCATSSSSDSPQGICMGVGDSLISSDAADNQPYSDLQAQIEGTVPTARDRLKHIFANMIRFYQMGDFTTNTEAASIYVAAEDHPAVINAHPTTGLNYWFNPIVEPPPGGPLLIPPRDNIFFAMPPCNGDGSARDINVEGQEAEYCGVYPTVDSITVDGNSTLADNRYDISNGRTVTLKFTSRVDVNQTALKYVFIDWGDGITTFERWNAAPTEHVFTHAYTCDPNTRLYEAAATETAWEDGLSSTCDFLPKITVVDNWNWCSGAIPITPSSGQSHRHTGSDSDINAKNVCGSYDIPNFLVTVDEAS